MTSPVEQIKKFQATLAVIVSVIGSWTYLNIWWSETVVSKQQWTEGNTALMLMITQSEIRAFQRYGLNKLTDEQRHDYENLVKAEQRLTCTRNKSLGMVDEC